MKFTPKSEKELAEMNLLPNGWYPFRIISAEEKQSKAGNDMLVLKTQAYHGNASSFIDDYIVANDFNLRKIRRLAVMCDALDKYEAGGITPDDVQDREGYARIGIQKSKDAQFADKNVIWDFAKEAPVDSKTPVAPKPAPGSTSTASLADSDDIPFASPHYLMVGSW